MSIPPETLRAIKAKAGDLIEIWASITPEGEDCITIKKFEEGCSLCGENESYLAQVNSGNICMNCADTASAKFEELLR